VGGTAPNPHRTLGAVDYACAMARKLGWQEDLGARRIDRRARGYLFSECALILAENLT
jgi:hypothetical protein